MPLPIGIPHEAGLGMAPHLTNQLHNLQLRGSRVRHWSSLGQAAISASSINYAVMQLPRRIPATTVMTAPGIYTDRASSKHKLSPICQLFMRLPKCRDLRNFRLENCFQLAGGGHGANTVTMIMETMWLWWVPGPCSRGWGSTARRAPAPPRGPRLEPPSCPPPSTAAPGTSPRCLLFITFCRR